MKQILFIFIITLFGCNSNPKQEENSVETPEVVFEEPVYKNQK